MNGYQFLGMRISKDLFVERGMQIVLGAIALIMLVLLSTSDAFSTLFFLGLLLTLNGIVSFFSRPLGSIGIGVEIILLSTIIASVVYGPKIGLVMGLLSALVNYAATGRFSIYCLVELPLYMVVGFAAGFAVGINLVVLGVAAAIFYNVSLNVLIALFLPTNYAASFVWSSSNVLWNYVVFHIAPFVVGLIR